MTRVAVLGMGLLGSGFAEGLLTRGGTDVVVWNRSSSKVEPLVALGAVGATSPAEAVRGADRVHIVLLDDDSVDTVVAECRDALAPGAVIVDHTTTRPDRTKARADLLAEAGVAYLHAPVMMGPASARQSTGIMLVAGPADVYARVEDALRVMTGELWFLGERRDLAAIYKLFGNAAMLSLAGVLADVMRLADATDVDRSKVMEMLTKLNFNGAVANRGPMMVAGNYAASFMLSVARKDIRLMQETTAGHPTPMLDALGARMDEVIAQGHGAEDMAVMAVRSS